MTAQSEKAEIAAEQKALGVERAAQSAWIKIIGTAAISLCPIVVGFYATKILEHLDRIDTFMAASDKSITLLRHDVDALQALVPQHDAQIKEVRDMTLQNKFDLQGLKDRMEPHR